MKFYYFNATHWDREWYLSKEAFRFSLVEMTSRLLDIFEKDPDFKKFTFDGQTIVLNDILEIRPDWKEKISNLIKEKKLNVGPWYVMPDEFLVSGEALIRNLLLGRKIARSFGAEPWPVSYICDIFGHIAQFPQISKGFGHEGIVAWRGFKSQMPPYLIWRSPDGTEMKLVHLMPQHGYAQFSIEVRGIRDVPMDEEKFKARFKEWLPSSQSYWGDIMVLSDALDHADPNHDTSKMLKWIKECCPEAEVIHTDYREVFANEYNKDKKIIYGEQIYPLDTLKSAGMLISHTLSSRYDVKKANDRCQNILELQIEPLLANAALDGYTDGLFFLDYAWKHLLQNHAHDSICGCSPDIVHRQMFPRFEEIETVADRINQELIFRDFEKIGQTSRFDLIHNDHDDGQQKFRAEVDPNGNYLLRIVNPLPFEIDKISEVEINFPAGADYPSAGTEPFGFEMVNNFEIFDENGSKIEYKIRKIELGKRRVMTLGSCRPYNIYTVVMRTKLRPSGWTEFSIRPSETPVRNFGSLLTGRRSASNGIISLQINDNGTFDITDLRSNSVYAGQNDYRFHRDVGDGWAFIEQQGGSVAVGGHVKSINITHDSSERAEFEIVRAFDLPEELIFKGTLYRSFGGIEPSKNIIAQEIRTFVALDRNSDQLSVRTEIDNKLKDYRLQLIVPTDIKGNYFASQQFYMVERAPGRISGRETEKYFEAEAPDKNFDGIVGKRNEKGGLAFIAKDGLHECGCLAENEGDLTVTMLRAFRRTVMHNGETECQLNKKLVYEYALKCLTPSCSMQELVHARKIMQLDKTASYIMTVEKIKEHTNSSFAVISGDLTFSALKVAENSHNEIIVRMVNLNDKNSSGSMKFDRKFKKAELCRLDETVEKLIIENDDSFSVNAAPWQIVSIKVTF